jgi:nucleoside-diphosphate-sugar epimerase
MDESSIGYDWRSAMRIFLTGATGYVGSAVLDAAVRGGHQVAALVRDPERAQALAARDVEVVVGTLGTPARYAAAAEASDVIIHAALDASKDRVEVDRQATEALLEMARRRAGRDEPASLIYTSGVWVLGNTAAPAAEDASVAPIGLVGWRPAVEALVLGAGDGRLRTAVVRPGVVYGGARGVIADLLRDAANGIVRIIGDGQNRWAAVYDRDLADLYVRVAESDEGRGIFHATDEADEQVFAIVEAIAEQARSRPDVRHMPLDEARGKLGAFAEALALDQVVRGPRARALGWSPTLRSIGGNVARLFEEYRAGKRVTAA